MYLRRRQFLTQNKKYFIIVFILAAAFYCEWFVFLIQPLLWPILKCRQDEICTKILFVADPQIQGELAAPSPLNHLFIYDSDQYLIRSFSVVTSYFKPDVLVYLGDIMDEGSIATKEQYLRYARRIRNIFPKTYYSAVEVWIPGDNDIGGEMEPIRKDKIEAFEQEFQSSSVITSNKISYYKVNGITNTFPKLEDNNMDLYKIVVSHYPVTLSYRLRNQVVDEIHPNILFCAHSHDSKYVINSENFFSRKTYSLETEILEVLPKNESLYEIYVPTCSYRMGTSKIGYGAAIFEHKSRILTYTVFWSPQRFPYLYFYLVVLLIAIIYAIKRCICKLRYGHSKSSVAEKENLLKTMMP